MLTRPTRRAAILAITSALLLGSTGCSGCGRSSDAVVTPLPKAVQDVGSIAQAYREAFEQTGKAPESFNDLRQYLISLGGNPDEMRVSPNDGQPYVVMWGADPTRGGPGPVKGMWSIVAHEQTGANGARAIADTRGLAITVTDEEFAKLTFIRKRKSWKSGEK
jgi:hypothetical protein